MSTFDGDGFYAFVDGASAASLFSRFRAPGIPPTHLANELPGAVSTPIHAPPLATRQHRFDPAVRRGRSSTEWASLVWGGRVSTLLTASALRKKLCKRVGIRGAGGRRRRRWKT